MSRMDDATTPRSEQRNGARWWQIVGSLPMAVTVIVAIEAVFILLVAFGNITDYATNFAFVQHVLSMDTTNFGGRPGTGLDPDIMWRAVTSPVAWNVAYVGIIVWESLAAILLVLATVLFVAGLVRGGFRTARTVASIGLLMIVVLFFGGFIAVGGEWFGMWRSTQWNGLDTAFRDGSLAGIGLILLHVPVAGWTRRSTSVRA
jgi:predicted small integral membrane protein